MQRGITLTKHIDMESAKIFRAIEETQFLKQLSFKERLFFIGEAEPIEYIRQFIAQYKQNDRNYYCNLSADSLENLSIVATEKDFYRAIVVVSMKNEASLYKEVRSRLDVLGSNLTVLRLFGDIFINLMCHRELLIPSSDEPRQPKASYAILTTPRSGSTFFCDLLSSTKIAGYPQEHLRLAAQELAKYCNFDYLRLLHNLMEHRITDNGVFGTKFISHFLFELQGTKPNFRQIFKSIDRFILLVRKDKVAQAVSLVLAQKTEIWHLRQNDLNQNNKIESYKSKLENINIDDDLLLEVEQKHKFIQNQEARLKKILNANQKEALEVVYENIVDDASSAIDLVLNFLDIDPSSKAIDINSQIKKMPSSISQEIIRQYNYKKNTQS